MLHAVPLPSDIRTSDQRPSVHRPSGNVQRSDPVRRFQQQQASWEQEEARRRRSIEAQHKRQQLDGPRASPIEPRAVRSSTLPRRALFKDAEQVPDKEQGGQLEALGGASPRTGTAPLKPRNAGRGLAPGQSPHTLLAPTDKPRYSVRAAVRERLQTAHEEEEAKRTQW